MATNPFETLDPQWAWEAWQPSDAQPWNASRVAHLFRRAGFGASRFEIEQSARSTLDEVLSGLMGSSSRLEAFENQSDTLANSVLATGDSKQLAMWWLHRMLHSPVPLVEKMTLFWHGHFATGAEKVKDPHLMLEQNRLLRARCLGSFREMAQGVAKDPAMLIYLDSAVNRKVHPNENFARELMELFCLGEGNYTEEDVQQLARCFTGWEVRRGNFRFNPYQHDEGQKNLLSRQVESGDQAIDCVLDSPAASRFIVTKLFQFFLADEPKPPQALIEPLAEQLRRDDWNLEGLVRRMLSSRIMFSPLVQGRKIRSPIEFALTWMRALSCTANLKQLASLLTELGQSLFYPPNVKGWDGGRAWINSTTLVARANLLPRLLQDGATRFASGSLAKCFQQFDVRDGESMVNWLQTYQAAIDLSLASREKIRETFDSTSGDNRYFDCIVLAASLPEMQLN